jgi:hypothetical protein
MASGSDIAHSSLPKIPTANPQFIGNVTSDLICVTQQLFVPESVAVTILSNLNGLNSFRLNLAGGHKIWQA